MTKLLPILLFLMGSGAGVGAGIFMRPEPAEIEAGHGEAGEAVSEHGSGDTKTDASHTETNAVDEAEYVKLNNQFVIPIVKQGRVVSLVVLALSVEVSEGNKDIVFRREPKVRDSFLQVLFDHANIGGFDGEFTDAQMLDSLRGSLREIAQKDLGVGLVKDVLILEIARQDY